MESEQTGNNQLLYSQLKCGLLCIDAQHFTQVILSYWWSTHKHIRYWFYSLNSAVLNSSLFVWEAEFT